MRRASPRSRGFTLVELVAVMTLSGILGLVVWRNITGPLRAFVDVSRRAELVDEGEVALNRMQRELRLALPNSVRVLPGGAALEFLRTAAGGRYRAETDPANPASDALDFTVASDSFDVLGGLAGGEPRAGGGGLAGCLAGDIDCVAIYNTGVPQDCAAITAARSNAWCGDNLAGLATYDAVSSIMTHDRADAGTPFPLRSPRQRFFVVDTPVTFTCDAGGMRRHAEYPISAVQSANPGGAAALLARHVESCVFSYAPGGASRHGLVTIRLVLSAENLDGGREAVTLLHQVPVVNTP
jgi:MSHA biogenesis protein MshO